MLLFSPSREFGLILFYSMSILCFKLLQLSMRNECNIETEVYYAVWSQQRN